MRAAQFAYFDAPLLALAHRGGSTHPDNVGLENTLHAFRTAVELGYGYLETDVHATSDGEVIAFHDARLDRVTDVAGAIAELPYAAVREARIGGREPVPTLRQVLESFPTTRVNIDIKAPGAIAPTVELVTELRAADRVCIGSFSERRLHAVRRLLPDVATAAGQVGTGLLRFAPHWTSMLLRSPAPALQVPEATRFRGREVTVVTPRLLDVAHRLGKQVHVWFYPWQEESSRAFHRLLDLGVDGLVVDRTDVLSEVLRERGVPWPAAARG